MGEPVLFIAQNFLPMGGIGVQRSVQFATRLHDYGYQPIVLTVSEEDLKHTGAKLDLDSANKLAGLEVHRVSSGQNYQLVRLLMRIGLYRFFWFFFFRAFWDRYSKWPASAHIRALELIKEHNIKLIYTSSSPYSAMELAWWLKRDHKMKWVADLRDPYTEHFGWVWPGKAQWKWSRRWEQYYFNRPDHMIVVTNEMKEQYLKRGIMTEDTITVITNGF